MDKRFANGVLGVQGKVARKSVTALDSERLPANLKRLNGCGGIASIGGRESVSGSKPRQCSGENLRWYRQTVKKAGLS